MYGGDASEYIKIIVTWKKQTKIENIKTIKSQDGKR